MENIQDELTYKQTFERKRGKKSGENHKTNCEIEMNENKRKAHYMRQ